MRLDYQEDEGHLDDNSDERLGVDVDEWLESPLPGESEKGSYHQRPRRMGGIGLTRGLRAGENMRDEGMRTNGDSIPFFIRFSNPVYNVRTYSSVVEKIVKRSSSGRNTAAESIRRGSMKARKRR